MINSTIESKKLRIHTLYLKQAEAKTRELTIWVNWIKPFFSTLMDKTPPLFKTKDDILPRIINQLGPDNLFMLICLFHTDNHTHDTPAKILRRQLRNDRLLLVICSDLSRRSSKFRRRRIKELHITNS
ncbi:hypothetical protein HRI_001513200 [Hibiscus trionum]|uniref:Uncharacterized protein n=1 Tax=Hibiscus trionum TaxID=183268 RepID=A0A9W7LV74_HIBTR|nr:hypothetical protein HRI_001513200 [Hibiscus trionum]